MNKSIKGALAAGAAAVLLLGGAGSLAFWTDSETVDGGNINAGHLALVTDATNAGCGEWQLDSGESEPTTYAAGDPLVPGDVLTKTCDFTLDVEGNHMRGTVEASAPTITGNLAPGLVVDVADLTVGGTAATEFTEADNGEALGVDVTVTFTDPGNADNTYNSNTTEFQAVLESITVTATQVHN